MVIGPTPPGTGVMAPATAAASAKATSPTSRVLPPPGTSEGTSTRLMPTSITVAPGFTQLPFTISGRPTAATRMSAPRQTAGRPPRAAVGDGDGAALRQQELGDRKSTRLNSSH